MAPEGTNCENGYVSSVAKSSQEHDENSKLARNFKITYAYDIIQLFKAYCILSAAPKQKRHD